MRLAAFVLLVACGREHDVARVELPPPPAPTPTASASVAPRAPAPFFAEDPALDAITVARPAFEQETWTGATEWQQHCREWGIEPSREGEVRDAINAALASRGVHLPDKPRAKGIVIALGSYATGVVEHGKLSKLVLCTEGTATRAAHEAFTARLLADPRAPHGPAFAGLSPDVAWERAHTSGDVEIGFRYPKLDAAASKRILDAVQATHDEHVNAKMRGTDLWWTGLRSR